MQTMHLESSEFNTLAFNMTMWREVTRQLLRAMVLCDLIYRA